MKYYKLELLLDFMSEDPNVHERADKELSKNFEEYHNIFKKLKLPKDFLEIYQEEKHFHDCHILGINYSPEIIKPNSINHRFSLIIESNHKIDCYYYLQFHNVNNLKYNINFDKYHLIEWLYAEFFESKDRKFTLEVLLDGGSLEFEFDSVHIRKLDKVDVDINDPE